MSLPDFALVFVIVLFRIRLTSGFVSIVVFSPLGFHLVLLSAGEDRFCCHFIHWLRWVCHSNELFLWDGVFNPVWFSPLARLSHWFCFCNRHHTGCLHGIRWHCHERRLCLGCFSYSLLVSHFLSCLVPPSLLVLLNLVRGFGAPSFELLALVPFLDFHLSLQPFDLLNQCCDCGLHVLWIHPLSTKAVGAQSDHIVLLGGFSFMMIFAAVSPFYWFAQQ